MSPNDHLRHACMTGSMYGVQTALDNGATDYAGGLFAACRAGHEEIALMMADHVDSYDLHKAIHILKEKDSPVHRNILHLIKRYHGFSLGYDYYGSKKSKKSKKNGKKNSKRFGKSRKSRKSYRKRR
jgi:hypothetical protein